MNSARTVLVTLVAAALLGGTLGCGGDDDSATTTEAGTQPPPKSVKELGERIEARKQSGAGSQAGPGEEGSSQGGRARQIPDTSESFEPESHSDSGGGAGQFRSKGGDNSIQDYGEEASGSEFDEAAAAVHGYLDARAARAWEAACGYMSSGIVKAFQQLAARAEKQGDVDCAQLLGMLSVGVPASALREAAQADIGSVRIEGDRGFVLYHGARNEDYVMPIAREDGEWKVGAIAGSPVL